MKHQIRSLVRRSAGLLDLSPEEFERIVTAKRNLMVALRVEEKFNLLLENYAEYERELLDLALRRLVFSGFEWSSVQNDIYTANRRLVNLLSAGRLYSDQLQHHLSEMHGRHSSILGLARTALAAEYDSTLGFRVIEAIRNHLQHRSLPVHQMAFGISRDEIGGQVFAKHTITPAVSILELRRDPKMKANIIEELEKCGSNIPLTPLVRGYVAALGRIHDRVRTAMAEDVGGWDSDVRGAVRRATVELGEERIGFAVVRMTDDGGETDVEQLFMDFIERRCLLERRSRHAAALGNHYVSGMAKLGDA